TRAFVVQVSDLRSITNATVTATAWGVGTISFRNDGVLPDVQAGDELYSASIAVPTNGANLTLTVTAVAPGFSSTNVTANFPVLIRPANDDFAGRIVVSGSSNLL